MKTTNDIALAFVSLSTGIVTDDGLIAVGTADIDAVLNAGVRAEAHYGMEASHVTNTTRKYQCNADLRYAKAIKELRTEGGFETDGAAIRQIMEAGLKALGFAKLVAEVQAERDGEDEE